MNIRRIIISIIFLLFLSYQPSIFADEGKNHEEIYLKDFTNNNHTQKLESHDSHDEGDTTNQNSHDSIHNQKDSDLSASLNQDHSINHEEQSHGSFVGKEKGPNYKVLSTFGIVNVGFLFIGIWNKLRKKEKKNDTI